MNEQDQRLVSIFEAKMSWVRTGRILGLTPFIATHKIWRGKKATSVMLLEGKAALPYDDAYTHEEWLKAEYKPAAYRRTKGVWSCKGKGFEGRIKAIRLTNKHKNILAGYEAPHALAKVIENLNEMLGHC